MVMFIGFGLVYFVVKIFWKNIYIKVEVEILKLVVLMGVINIVEGVILLVMNDIVWGVVVMVIGGFVGGVMIMILGVDVIVFFGGVLMILMMFRFWVGVIVILVNVFVIVVVLVIIKKDVGKEVEFVVEKEEEDIDLGDI